MTFFGLEIMWGAMLFNAINVVIALIMIYIAARICLTASKIDGSKYKERKQLQNSFTFLVIFLVIFGVINLGAASPKRSIDLPQNSDLIDYNENLEEVEIVTPPPRVEFLEGFEPIKKESK